jgi:hypothetical protein
VVASLLTCEQLVGSLRRRLIVCLQRKQPNAL